MSLKAKIRNIAKQKNIPAQVILQNYMFERLLVRLAASEYKDKFVLKGGMLVAAIVGLDNRATMDLDTTLKNLSEFPAWPRSAYCHDTASALLLLPCPLSFYHIGYTLSCGSCGGTGFLRNNTLAIHSADWASAFCRI